MITRPMTSCIPLQWNEKYQLHKGLDQYLYQPYRQIRSTFRDFLFSNPLGVQGQCWARRSSGRNKRAINNNFALPIGDWHPIGQKKAKNEKPKAIAKEECWKQFWSVDSNLSALNALGEGMADEACNAQAGWTFECLWIARWCPSTDQAQILNKTIVTLTSSLTFDGQCWRNNLAFWLPRLAQWHWCLDQQCYSKLE